ncbi:MAG TPA: hypothetical protein VFS76_05365 [Pyrinomonadaceae bacterium]|nr:hypothetical protein [Pyrinomonadaceae bacterium]
MKKTLRIWLMMIYPSQKPTSRREDRTDDKFEEIWIIALSNAGVNRIVDMPDSTTRSSSKSTINLLPKVSGQVLSMRWHHGSLLQDL